MYLRSCICLERERERERERESSYDEHVRHIDLELFEKALFIPSSLFEVGVHSCINDARGI